MDADPVLVYPASEEGGNSRKERLFTKPFRNVLVSATAMCLVYSAFFPGGGLLDVVITDARGSGDANVGFLSQALTYLSSISIALITPPIIHAIGVRVTLALSCFLYCGLFIGIIFVKNWTIYLGSFVTGIGMGMLWVVAPKIVADCSTERNIQRNNSVWWCIYIFSMVIGNTADYFYLGGLTKIETKTRVSIYLVCCILVILAGVVAIFGYRDLTANGEETDDHIDDLLCSKSIQGTPLRAEGTTVLEKIKYNLRLYKVMIIRKEVGYLLILLFYNSFVLAFYTMTYQTCIGNVFPDRNLIPLMSLIFGAVAVIACPLFESMVTIFDTKKTALILYLLAIVSYYLIFLTFPSAATYGESDDPTVIKPRKWLVLLIAVMLAITDTGFNVQANSTVCLLFKAESEIGFMLLNSVMSGGTALIFFLVSYINLYLLLGILVLFCTAGTICIVMDLYNIGL